MKDLKGRKIEIKPIDIKRGVRASCDECPVALAISRATRISTKWLSVTDERMTVFMETGWVEYRLPKKATTFIERFDDEKPVKPFSFVLR